MDKLISVVVPVYNVEEYLEECLNSIINQSYKNLEIILVDDGSTDKSGYICDDFSQKDNRIKVIHKENGGLSDARNVGIKSAKGEFIYLIDSDDFICSKDALERMYHLFNEEVDIVLAYSYEKRSNSIDLFCDYNKNISHIELHPLEAIALMYDWRTQKYTFTVAHNKLYRKKLFQNISYPRHKLHEDEFTTYKLYLQSRKIILFNETTYAYRIRKDSIMNTTYHIQKLDILEAFEERLEIFYTIKNDVLIKKTKDYYFYSLLYHRMMLYQNKLKEYKAIDKKYKDFMKRNPRYYFSRLRYLFFISKLKFMLFKK